MAENEEVKESARMAGSDWYENARREWNERYGGYIARARAWRLAATGALVVAAIAVAGIGWIGARVNSYPISCKSIKRAWRWRCSQQSRQMA